MVTKGYGWTVEMIDWACPADLEPYEKAYQLERKSIDSYTYSAVGGYGISALVFAIEHCLNGKKARTKYMDAPIMGREKEENSYRESKEEVARFEMQQRIEACKLQGLPESPM